MPFANGLPRALPAAVALLMLTVSLAPLASASGGEATQPVTAAAPGLIPPLSGESAGEQASADSTPLAGGAATSPATPDDVRDVPATVITGGSNLDHAGASLAAVGDLNGDHLGDFAYATRNPWRVNIVAGEGGSIPASAVRTFGGQPGEMYGARIAGDGDLNGDQLDDIAVVVGVPQSDGTTLWRVEVLLGASLPLIGNQGVTIQAPSSAKTFASGIAVVPDVNGDGFDDLLVTAAPESSTGAGWAWIFAGSAQGPSTTPSWSFQGQAGEPFGAYAASAGDLNRDGYGDFVVTTGGASGPTGYATAYIFLGAPSMNIRAPSARVGEQAGDGFGASVASGDFNGDGYADLVVGAPGFDLGAELSDAGKVYEIRGSAAGLASTIASTRTGGAGQRYASSVAAVGDLNGDGFEDVVVGAPLASADGPFTNGQFFAYFGGNDGLSRSYDFTEAGLAGNDLYGAAAAGPGDMDGDGTDELVVAAPGQDIGGNPDAGALHVFDGKRLRLPASALIVEFPDLTDGQALARRPAPYHAVATVVYRGDIAELSRLELRLVCPTTGRMPALSWVPDEPVALADGDGDLLELAPDTAVAASGTYRHGVQVRISLRFAWSLDEQQALDVEVWASDGRTESALTVPAAFEVNSRLEFSQPLRATGQDGRTIQPGGFVRAGEVIGWSGGNVVYEGTQVVPAVSEFYVRVGGGSSAPTRASVDALTGAISARRAAPLQGEPAPAAYVEALSGTDLVLARQDNPLTVDGTPATFGAANPPSGSTLSEADVQVSVPVVDALSGVNPASLEWSISHATPPVFDVWQRATTSGTSPVVATASVRLAEGQPNHIAFRATDRVGNGPAVSPAVTLSLDYGAVDFQLISPREATWLRSGDVTLNFAVSNTRGVDIDLSTLEYMVAAPTPGPWVPVGLTGQAPSTQFPLRLSLPDSAANTVTLRAQLSEGGSYWSKPFAIFVDASAPSVQVLAPTSTGWVTDRTTTTRVFIQDTASGVDTASVRYRFLPPGGTVWSAWQQPTVQVAPDGVFASAALSVSDGTDNFVEWSVKDNAGNGPTMSGYLRILVDTRPVVFGVVSPADGASLDRINRLSISVRDVEGSGVDLSSVQFLVFLPDGRSTGWLYAGAEGIVSESTVSVVYELPVGTSVVQWRARDLAGTPTQVSAPVTVTVEPPRGPDLSPRIVLRGPVADGHYLAGVDLKIDATASFDPEGRALSFSWWVDGVEQEEGGPVIWVDLGPGRHAVTLIVTDGTSGAAVKTIEFDVVEPATAPPALSSTLEQALIVSLGALAVLAFVARVWAERARRSLRR